MRVFFNFNGLAAASLRRMLAMLEDADDGVGAVTVDGAEFHGKVQGGPLMVADWPLMARCKEVC